MSKKGKARRTRARRVADREARSSVAYLRRIQREVEQEMNESETPEEPSNK